MNKKNMYPNNWDGSFSKNVFMSPQKPLIIAGPCMFETRELGFKVGRFLKEKCAQLGLPYVFKSSFDKANRTSQGTARGPGLNQGLTWLAELRRELDVPVLTDVHSPEQAIEAGKIVDVIQIPAFLFQQRELLAAAASTGKVVQVKKGQWACAEEMIEVANYLNQCGNNKVTLVERGTNFGYNNLVVDFRNLVDMKKENHAVIFDATHAVQLPSAASGKSSGLRHMVRPLVRAALAVGVDGIFMEVHECPEKALSDADTQISMELAEVILEDIARMTF
jgi:2-dehydro-3-deoxyphosphooctonate aldolase (KDO 8-P synthase)